MSTALDADFIALQAALAGEYSLDREIGRGGMGIVYLAREVRLARPVAIKVLPPRLAANPGLREAFLRESQTVARLNHPNIVQVYAAGERGGFVYIAMAFIEGVTLGERIRARGPLLPGQAARVMREVAWALAYAHGAGIVHRDISAENILLERGSDRAIVTDFGIASAMETSALDVEGRVVGNAHYVSPEQIAGQPLDARSDLYSLGVVGYYALTGRLPFDAANSSDVITKHLTEIAPAISTVSASVPPRLASAVERCLHKEPFRRYRNAESLAEAIDLAFEHAKEIPIPLRVWINTGEKELPARLGFVGIGAMAGIALAFATLMPALFLVPFVPLVSMSYFPAWQRLRRVMADGYEIDDLHAALREHQLARAEEIEYERRQSSPRYRKAVRVLFAASTVALGGVVWMHVLIDHNARFVTLNPFRVFLNPFTEFVLGSVSLSGLTFTAVALAGEFVRLRLATRIANASIRFWKGKWGARLGALATWRLKRAIRPAIGMPMLTEVALGRATEHLFKALPRDAKRELAALPATVRRLESDASTLRQTLASLDDQLSAFETGSSIADVARGRMAAELTDVRTIAAHRLAATVSALENIRLDLLRLQIGSANIASVTASLEAAQHVGAQIELAVEAREEVERLLRPATSATRSHDGRVPDKMAFEDAATDSTNAYSDDTDSDTPVGGVEAARA